MSHTPFTAAMKLSDVLFENRNLLLLLPRFGIPVGFGEKTIGQICAEQGVSTDLFLYVCNAYCYEGFSASDEHFAKMAAEAPCRIKKAVVKLRADLF